MKELYKSLAGFQQDCPAIVKANSGYGYKYADLPAILEIINPLMRKHGLGFTQLLNGQSVETIVYHCETGQSIKSITDIPQNVQLKGMNDFQVLGSACTYIRRYSLSSVLGVVTDVDTDAHGEQIKPQEKTKTERKEKFSVRALNERDYKNAKEILEKCDNLETFLIKKKNFIEYYVKRGIVIDDVMAEIMLDIEKSFKEESVK